MSWSEMVDLYRITESGPRPNLGARYNVAPTQDVPIVRATGTGGRELARARWGLVPSWAKDIAIGARMINARAETVAEKPSFRAAFKSRRCLVPADGFYEWRNGPAGKQPYRITLADGEPFAFGGLWERWDKAPDGRTVESCTIITTLANDLLRPIHARMPVILDPGDYDPWLEAGAMPPAETARLLKPFPDHRMKAYPVATRVNNPRNDDPECLEPLGPAT